MSSNQCLHEIELKVFKSDVVSTIYNGGQTQGHTKEIVNTKETKECLPIVVRPRVFFVDQHGHEIILLQDFKK